MHKVKEAKAEAEGKAGPKVNRQFKDLYDWRIDGYRYVQDDHWNCRLCLTGKKRHLYKSGHGYSQARVAIKRGRPSNDEMSDSGISSGWVF